MHNDEKSYWKLFNEYDKCSSGCLTTEGEACKFPFTYQGAEYFECTSIANNGVPWCGTANGGWGNCKQSCDNSGYLESVKIHLCLMEIFQVA